ncbi:hypothetical protein H696_05421 [Fonticula alba]|uniref:Uncharacterized protein n=1 Tax=Fonticula alba TaxID=691883 RepID=A0A058Z241_FONAL|nr:hypothetical protein H696_05421 [Fonticula alba]KCV67963.1 hypothetical protein H696_05421 [Fonticula alba]|eukprot:XP_009497530.1 hypothetical protein H696_05421 [Fonticula alba]
MLVAFSFHHLGQGKRAITLPASCPTVKWCLNCLDVPSTTKTQIRALARQRWVGDMAAAGIKARACKADCHEARLALATRLAAHQNKLLLSLHGSLVLAEFDHPLHSLHPDLPDGPAKTTLLKNKLCPEAHLEPTTTPGQFLLADPSHGRGLLIPLDRLPCKTLVLSKGDAHWIPEVGQSGSFAFRCEDRILFIAKDRVQYYCFMTGNLHTHSLMSSRLPIDQHGTFHLNGPLLYISFLAQPIGLFLRSKTHLFPERGVPGSDLFVCSQRALLLERNGITAFAFDSTRSPNTRTTWSTVSSKSWDTFTLDGPLLCATSHDTPVGLFVGGSTISLPENRTPGHPAFVFHDTVLALFQTGIRSFSLSMKGQPADGRCWLKTRIPADGTFLLKGPFLHLSSRADPIGFLHDQDIHQMCQNGTAGRAFFIHGNTVLLNFRGDVWEFRFSDFNELLKQTIWPDVVVTPTDTFTLQRSFLFVSSQKYAVGVLLNDQIYSFPQYGASGHALFSGPGTILLIHQSTVLSFSIDNTVELAQGPAWAKIPPSPDATFVLDGPFLRVSSHPAPIGLYHEDRLLRLPPLGAPGHPEFVAENAVLIASSSSIRFFSLDSGASSPSELSPAGEQHIPPGSTFTLDGHFLRLPSLLAPVGLFVQGHAHPMPEAGVAGHTVFVGAKEILLLQRQGIHSFPIHPSGQPTEGAPWARMPIPAGSTFALDGHFLHVSSLPAPVGLYHEGTVYPLPKVGVPGGHIFAGARETLLLRENGIHSFPASQSSRFAKGVFWAKMPIPAGSTFTLDGHYLRVSSLPAPVGLYIEDSVYLLPKAGVPGKRMFVHRKVVFVICKGGVRLFPLGTTQLYPDGVVHIPCSTSYSSAFALKGPFLHVTSHEQPLALLFKDNFYHLPPVGRPGKQVFVDRHTVFLIHKNIVLAFCLRQPELAPEGTVSWLLPAGSGGCFTLNAPFLAVSTSDQPIGLLVGDTVHLLPQDKPIEALLASRRVLVSGQRVLSLHDNFLLCHEYPFGEEQCRPAAFVFALQLPLFPATLSFTADFLPAQDTCRVLIDGQWSIVVDLARGRPVDFLPGDGLLAPSDPPALARPTGGTAAILPRSLVVLDAKQGALAFELLVKNRRLLPPCGPARLLPRWAFRPARVFPDPQPGVVAMAAGNEVTLLSLEGGDLIRGHLRLCLSTTQLDDGSLVMQFADGYFDMLSTNPVMHASRLFPWRDTAGCLDQIWVCPWFPLSWVAYHASGEFVFHSTLRKPNVTAEPWAFVPARRSFSLGVSTWPRPAACQPGITPPLGVAFIQHKDQHYCVLLHGQRLALIPRRDIIRLFIDPASQETLSKPLLCWMQDIRAPVQGDICVPGPSIQQRLTHPTVVLRRNIPWKSSFIVQPFTMESLTTCRTQIPIRLWSPS